MELYAKGQLSFLILTCLQERDFYGLDIISEISNRSNGRINLKKPSVYSNLTRMEKQGYISAYLQSSDFGPNRKYYSLTESGRNFYKELKEYFDRNNIDVFRDFVDADSPAENSTSSTQVSMNENAISQENSRNDSIDNNVVDDFFDFSSIDSEESTPADSVAEQEEETVLQSEETTAQNESITNDFKFIESAEMQQMPAEEKKEETFSIKDVLTNNSQEQDTASIDEYNKRLYDISKDINKYKRKRSFAEDQIAMTATAPLNDAQEKNKANLEDFKSSFLENKNKYQGERITNLDFSRYTSSNRTVINETVTKQEEVKNDAVFITQRVNSSDIERPKRIEPPRLRINPTEPVKETKLPAPKRDLSIDPSHKEILTKLYEKTKDGNDAEVREDALYDFNDLKRYYNKQNITFTEYKKPAERVKHNTNKLYLIVSIFTFLCSAGLSAILYAVLLNTGLINTSTNFLYIVLPALLLVDVAWRFYNYKKYKGWLPSQMLPQWQIWALFFIIAGLIICLNFVCSMSPSNFANYATTTILPLVMIFVALPARYYFKRIILVKYWK